MKDKLNSTDCSSIQEIQALFSKVFEDAPMGAIIMNSSFIITDANKTAAADFGKTEDDLKDKNLFNLLQDHGYSNDLKEFRRQLIENGSYRGNLTHAEHGTPPVNLNMSCTRINVESTCDTSAHVLIYERDNGYMISDDKLVELDRMLTRGEMAGEIAHEINNYLTILLGNVELMPLFLKKKAYEDISKKLPRMKNALEKIASLSENLAAYGKQQDDFKVTDLSGLIKHTIEFLKPQNRYDGIEIITELPSSALPVRGERGRLQQALVNLLHNAADVLRDCTTPNPTILIKAETSTDGNSIIVSVSDEGWGIAEKIKAKLFIEPCTTKESGEGYGLLACKKIIEQHGGEISIQTQSDKGTTVRCTLPAMKSTGSTQGLTQSQNQQSATRQ